MYSPEKTRYFPKACCRPTWNSFRHPGSKGVVEFEAQTSNGLSTGLAQPAGKDEVLVERGFEHPSIRRAKHGTCLLDVVSHPHARLRFCMRSEAVIDVAAHSDVEGPVSLADRILHIDRQQFDVGVPVERKQRAAARQVRRQQQGIEPGIWESAGILGAS